MPSDKRRRQLAREKYDRQQSRRAETAARRRVRQRIIAAVVVAVLIVGAVAWVVVSRSTSTSPVASPTAAPAAGPTVEPTGEAVPTSSAAASAVALNCSPPPPQAAGGIVYTRAPEGSPLSKAPAVITLETNCGPIEITTLPDKAPKTVASEVFLANSGFYDNTACHRVTTSGLFVLQCGDPKGDGTGGPGYTVPDENLPTADGVNYPAGTVAMANAGPGTSGSQFFIVYRDTTLPPGYSIWGTVTKGLDLVTAIAAKGATGGGGDGAPVQPISITSASVRPA